MTFLEKTIQIIKLAWPQTPGKDQVYITHGEICAKGVSIKTIQNIIDMAEEELQYVKNG